LRNAIQAPLLAALLTTAVASAQARAEDVALAASIIAATTTGYWQDNAAAASADTTSASNPATTAIQTPVRHGYYKLYAVRQSDRTSKVYLQQISSSDDGPHILSTSELTDITAMKAIVTDIRPENSGGNIREPGLFATIFLKADPESDAEPWNIMRDELGELSVERAP